MRLINKENKGKKINLYLDYPNYSKFIGDVLKIGQKYEKKSNPKKLKYAVVLNSVKIPTEPVKGWSSRTSCMKSVIFFDFDNTLLWLLKAQIEILIKEYNLSSFYLFATELTKDSNGDDYGNFLVFCPDKHNFSKVSEIQDRTTCDVSFKRLPQVYRFKGWCWRWSKKFSKDKPQFLGIIKNPKKPSKQEVSTAHLKLMRQLYPEVPKIKYLNEDKSDKLWIVEYKTSSR